MFSLSTPGDKISLLSTSQLFRLRATILLHPKPSDALPQSLNLWQKPLLARQEGTALVLGLAVRPSKLCRHHRAQGMPGSPCYDALQRHSAMGLCSMNQTGYSHISIQPRKSAAAESPRSHRVGLLLAGVSSAPISAVKTTKNRVFGSPSSKSQAEIGL